MSSRAITTLIVGATTITALVILIDRGGLIAWGTFLVGAALLAKIWLKPSPPDLALGIGLATLAAVAWFGTLYYVLSTWESGEVVELAIDLETGSHTARVWVLDIGADPTVYYDAEPEVAESLLAGTPLQFTRAGVTSTRSPDAVQVDAMPEDEANRVLEAMVARYGDRVAAADIYYAILGRSRDRVAVVASLIEK